VDESLLISDLHLSPRRPGATRLFLDFLEHRAAGAERLFVLGDLFDAWIGDDACVPPGPEVIRGLRQLADSGTGVLVMHGNRDFLLGERFAAEAGCTLIPDPYLVDLYGTPTLLAHGDALCADDAAYQAFRRQIRAPAFVAGFLAKPIEERVTIAAEYRRRSGEANSLKPADIMDVNQESVASLLNRHGVRRLVHGHTHRPADHHFDIGGEAALRVVLSEWHEDRGEVLCATPDGLKREPINAGR